MESKPEFVLPLAFSVCFRTALSVIISFVSWLLKVPGTDGRKKSFNPGNCQFSSRDIFYSVLSVTAGFLFAALIDSKLTVRREININAMIGMINNSAEMLVLWA